MKPDTRREPQGNLATQKTKRHPEATQQTTTRIFSTPFPTTPEVAPRRHPRRGPLTRPPIVVQKVVNTNYAKVVQKVVNKTIPLGCLQYQKHTDKLVATIVAAIVAGIVLAIVAGPVLR